MNLHEGLAALNLDLPVGAEENLTAFLALLAKWNRSYNLTASFALGTNPDIDVVNVNNRVQAALARLPAEVQKQGVNVRKRSAASSATSRTRTSPPFKRSFQSSRCS